MKFFRNKPAKSEIDCGDCVALCCVRNGERLANEREAKVLTERGLEPVEHNGRTQWRRAKAASTTKAPTATTVTIGSR